MVGLGGGGCPGNGGGEEGKLEWEGQSPAEARIRAWQRGALARSDQQSTKVGICSAR